MPVNTLDSPHLLPEEISSWLPASLYIQPLFMILYLRPQNIQTLFILERFIYCLFVYMSVHVCVCVHTCVTVCARARVCVSVQAFVCMCACVLALGTHIMHVKVRGEFAEVCSLLLPCGPRIWTQVVQLGSQSTQPSWQLCSKFLVKTSFYFNSLINLLL